MSDESFTLLYPFVTVTSVGGPHDDASYAAGWEMGKIDAQLALAASLGICTLGFTVHRANREQADLVAMHHGFVVNEVEMDENEISEIVRNHWCWLSFTPMRETEIEET